LPIGTHLVVAPLKEDCYAVKPRRYHFVPTTGTPIALKQLWEAIPQVNRQQTLHTLSRLVAQQLQSPPKDKEVCDEDC
jgi:hypothetical protein